MGVISIFNVYTAQDRSQKILAENATGPQQIQVLKIFLAIEDIYLLTGADLGFSRGGGGFSKNFPKF